MSEEPGGTPSDAAPVAGAGRLRRRLRDAFGRRTRGDVIAADIGESARGVAVGKNIIQIGTLVIPTLPVVALLLVALAGLGLAGWRAFTPSGPRGPARMSGGFNVAIADFGGQDASGKTVRSTAGERLSQWVFEAFQAQKDQRPDLKAAVQVWQDSMPPDQKSVTIGSVPGDSIEARARSAETLADRLGADMLIYGNVDSQNRLSPEFYVSPALRSGADIHGHFQLGSAAIPVDLSAGLALNRELTTRTLALFWLAMGLSYDRGGLSADSLAALRQAEALGDWQGPGQGKEVLYFFIGQAALFAGHDVEAETAFNQALGINPAYAGAAIGLGSVHFTRAQNLQPPRLRLETADMQQAVDEYRRAAELAPRSPDKDWASYAAPLALAMAERLSGDAYLDEGDLSAAGLAFDRAVSGIQAVLPALTSAREYRLLGQAYLALGTAFAEQGDLLKRQGRPEQSRAAFQAARQAYASCIGEGKAAPLDEILTKTVIAGLCQPYDRAASDALAALGG